MNLKQYAVVLTVLFALTVSLVSVTIIFYEFFKLNRIQYLDSIFTKYSVITQIYKEHQQRNSSDILLEANLAVYNFRMEKNKTLKKVILQHGNILKQEGFQSVDDAVMLNSYGVFTKKVVSDLRATMLQYKSIIYFHIETPSGSIIIEDEELKPYRPWNILYVYTTVIAVIAFSFFLILQKLRPLIRLRRKIALFGNGNLNISFKTNGSDEIALVSNELENARKKINTILDSRTLFLRNIMHELKTPIAKGTIATQMLESQKQRDRFCSIFGRLESLVNEFALIEEVTSIGDKAEFNEYRLIDVIDGAIDMAMVDVTLVSVEVEPNTKVHVNYKLYTTAIKNMIDNGIKYSSDSKVAILYKNNELYFESRGECIKHSLQYYIEPFTKENPSKNSFGLGLYLVDSILKVHEQVLAHEYEDGINRFIFV
ncbi:MAG: ArsS family sensor histidine kinase [Sulfurimonadaceae bacterium]|jgi:two-component system OmpR family sensor kinase|nr:ArsS family sensor histidine kinase [Sulfurimonadaceae bacterium]